MEQTTKHTSGFLAFLAVFTLLLIAFVAFQTRMGEFAIEGMFPAYDLVPDVIPSEWIILSRTFDEPEAAVEGQPSGIAAIIHDIRAGKYDPDPAINALMGKRDLLDAKLSRGDMTVFFINPYVAFIPLYVFASAALAFALSLFFPVTSSLSWIRGNLLLLYQQMEFMLRKQFEGHHLSLDELMSITETDREQRIRASSLPDVVISELGDFMDISRWIAGRSRNPIHPLKFYFRYRLTPKYGNLIQGLVSGGAAILIFVIGLRGLKLIPPEEPSLILMSLSIEFILLIVLMISFAGSAQEERLDRVLKELEVEQREAISRQTESLQQLISTQGSGSGGGGTARESLADYEERRILDEVLSLMIRHMGGRGRDTHAR